MELDFHTHDLNTPPGAGIVCLPQCVVQHPDDWMPQPGGRYAAGIHPWWTVDADFSLSRYLEALTRLLAHPEVEQIGECGFDRLRGADIERQRAVFDAQVALAEDFERPMTLHVVRAFDLILEAHKRHHPHRKWTIHGFRGKPALAQQLLDAGFDLSFGRHYNPEAFALTPLHRRHRESDSGG